MQWNVQDIEFLHSPDTFTGEFANDMMQERHEQQLRNKLKVIKETLAAESDPLRAMKALHKRDHLRFLLNNREGFLQADRFEEAVLLLYLRRQGPFSSSSDVPMWSELFETCNRDKLYSLGDPITFATATVYRGSVMGRKDSLSWSTDRQRALWFTERWNDPVGGGTIYEVTITRKDALILVKQSRESEIILSPPFIRTAEIRIFNPAG